MNDLGEVPETLRRMRMVRDGKLDADIDAIIVELWEMLLGLEDQSLARVFATCYLEHFRFVCGSYGKIKAMFSAEKAELAKCQAEIDADQAAKEKENP